MALSKWHRSFPIEHPAVNFEIQNTEMLYILLCGHFFDWIINKKAEDFSSDFVRARRLELPHLGASDSKSDMSTNSTMPTFNKFLKQILVINFGFIDDWSYICLVYRFYKNGS